MPPPRARSEKVEQDSTRSRLGTRSRFDAWSHFLAENRYPLFREMLQGSLSSLGRCPVAACSFLRTACSPGRAPADSAFLCWPTQSPSGARATKEWALTIPTGNQERPMSRASTLAVAAAAVLSLAAFAPTAAS